MRTVVSRTEVFNLWAKQLQSNATEAKGGRTYFSGNTCYSYGDHFPIAKILGDGNCLFTLRSYSNTTSKHIIYARRAAYNANLNLIYCYDINSTSASLVHWFGIIDQTISEIKNPHNRKFTDRVSRLKHTANQLKTYIQYFKIELSFEQATKLAFIQSDDIVSKLRDSKSSVLKAACKRDGIKCVNHKLANVNPEDYKGLPS